MPIHYPLKQILQILYILLYLLFYRTRGSLLESGATGLFTGITRTTGRAELVKAAVDCTAYQIADLSSCCASNQACRYRIAWYRWGSYGKQISNVQLQSDIAGAEILVSSIQELFRKRRSLFSRNSISIYDENTIFGGRALHHFHRLLPEQCVNGCILAGKMR